MGAISKIRLHNFKAFYTGSEPEELDLEGKNLLLYGENGSGKSSIYWALYTLFQSETKNNDEIAKYFTPIHDEQLINYNYLTARADFEIDEETGNILNPTDIGKNSEIEVILEDGVVLKLNKEGSQESEKDKIRNLHRRSDFITHRLLVNFYNFRNSKQINLWEVFVRDFFPFLQMSKGKSDVTLWQKLKEIENDLPFNIDEATGKLTRSKSQSWQKKIENEINKFNNDVDYWIGRINTLANEVYKNELKITDNLEIFLEYNEKLRYDHYKDNIYKKNGKEYNRWTTFAGLNEPIIKLIIRKVSSEGRFAIIHRPQAYLNEARITQIALSIRFSLLHATVKPDYPGQFLVLDDLLISLDMSNRDIVIDAILDIYAKRYKIYLFTHERIFFNMMKRRLANRNLLEEWKIKEVFMNDFIDPPKPKIVNTEDYLSIALKHLKKFDLPASANYLRKECEFRLKYLLPENFAKKETEDDTKFIQLENLITNFLKYFSETLHQDISKFLILKEKKDLILNPLSHDNLDSEIYKNELLQLHDLLLELKSLKKIVVLKCDEEFYFEQIDSEGSMRNYKVRACENLLYYKALDNSVVHKNIKCQFLSFEISGNSTILNQSVNYKDLQKVAYKHSMNGATLPNYLDHLQEFHNSESKKFQDLLIELNI